MKILLLVIFISCGHQQKHGEIISSIPIDSNEKTQVKIDNTISEQNNISNITDEKIEKKKPKVGVVLYPSIYFTQASIELFKEFEKNQLKFILFLHLDSEVFCALYMLRMQVQAISNGKCLPLINY